MQPITHGETYEEALKNGQEVLELIIEEYQEDGKTLRVNREYYAGEEAWNFIKTRTGFDLKQILIDIAAQKTPEKS